MHLRDFLAAAAALSMAATPVVAKQANPAAKLSLANKNVRASALDEGTTKAGRNTYLFVGLGLVAVVVAALALGGGGGDSKPASP